MNMIDSFFEQEDGARIFVEEPRNMNSYAKRLFSTGTGERLLESCRGCDQMIFTLRGKDVSGTSAIEVVRSLERDDKEYHSSGGPIRQYLIWSLNRLNGSVPPRDLDLSDTLEDETLALDYLLLLDEYGVGKIQEPV